MSIIVLKSKERLSAALINSINCAGRELNIPESELTFEKLKPLINFFTPKPALGDLSCNIAMVCASLFKKSPSDLAEIIASRLNLEGTEFERCVPFAGYLNFYNNKDFYPAVLREVISRDKSYGQNEYGFGKSFSIKKNSQHEERLRSISILLKNIFILCGYKESLNNSDENILLCSHKAQSNEKNHNRILYVNTSKIQKIDQLNADTIRFIYNSEKASTQININEKNIGHLDYVQFAYARICSAFRCLEMDGITLRDYSTCELLCSEDEIKLIKAISDFSDQLILAAKMLDTSRIIRYSIDISTLFHRFYNSSKIRGAPENLMQARLTLCKATQITLRNTLAVCEIIPLEIF